MWVITRNIIEYVCNENISKEKRIKTINKKKDAIIEELLKLNPDLLVKLLFDSKVLKELKLIICETINGLSVNFDDVSNDTIKVLIDEFRKLKKYQERYILSDTCPKVFKREILVSIYKEKPYDIVKNKNVSKSIKKVILKNFLTRNQLEHLLIKEISVDLKQYIIDECFNGSYDIACFLNTPNIPEEYKIQLVEKRVNKSNLFSIFEYANIQTVDFILSLKSKEFDEYLCLLKSSNVLKVINDNSTPKIIVDYIFENKYDVIVKAVDRAWREDLEDSVFKEKNLQLLKLIYERRAKAIYRVIDKLYDFQLLSFLNLRYLPKEYKDYILNKKKWRLNNSIDRLGGYDAVRYMNANSNVPDDIQQRIFEKKKDVILEYYSDENNEEIVRTIRYGDLSIRLKRLLIENRIDLNNIFDLLGSNYIDKETVELTLKIKKDLIIDLLHSCDNDKLFKGNFVGLESDVIESLLDSNEDVLRNRLHLLSQEELYNYLKHKKVVGVVKRLILEKIGIDKVNVKNVLLLITMYDVNFVLDNYENIKDLIYGVGIDFNSFLQYGSGSKKYSKWFDNLVEIIRNDDIGDFSLCKDYLFNNYYDSRNENSVYIISSFLEYLDNYNKYKELFVNLINNEVKLSKFDKDNLRFLFNISSNNQESFPKSIHELKKFKLELYRSYIQQLNDPSISLSKLQYIFNNVLFCEAQDILTNIGGSGALRTLKKDNMNSSTVVDLVDELMLYSSIIEMVNYTNNKEGLKDVLIYIFSDIDLLTKIQNMFSVFEDKVRNLYELDSINNLTTVSEARSLGMIDNDLSNVYGGEVFDYSDKNYCLYGHILSDKENIVDVIDGVSTGNSNFISVSPVSYRGQKYYFDIDEVIVAYDKLPIGSFICSSVVNMGSNGSVSANSSEVANIRRVQRGILETSAVIERNAEALLYREGLKPCGLILPGGRVPSKRELEIHEKYGLPFIITQPLHKSIDDPNYVFVNNLKKDFVKSDTTELELIIDMLRPNVVHLKENDIYTGKEIAVFADSHSMYEPTLAVLEDIKRRGITEIYSLGDNVGLGPNPVEVFDLLCEFGVKSIAGNAEYYNTIGTGAFPYLTDGRLDNQLWTERKLGPERIKELRLYPASIDIALGNKKIALCHFANDVRWDFRDRSVHTYAEREVCNSEQLRYTNSEEAIRNITSCIVSNKGDISLVKGYIASKEEPLFGGKLVTDYNYVLQGHYHFELSDRLDNTKIFTLRAVAMGYEGTEKVNQACYYILKERKDGDVDIDKIYVPFNVNALLSSIYTCDLPSKQRVLSYVKKSR